MRFGPIVWREFLITSRRRGTFAGRLTWPLLALGLIGAYRWSWDLAGWDRTSVAGMAAFTRLSFALVVALQLVMTAGAVLGGIARGLAEERERRTLDPLVTTRLSSLEIVLGAAAATLLQRVNAVLVLLPLSILMVPGGGLDPRWIGLALAGVCSIALANAAIAVVASIGAATLRRAAAVATGYWLSWMFLPFLAVMLLPRFWPGAYGWLSPAILLVLDSSPAGVALNFVGMLRRCGPVEAVLRMIGLQVLGASLLLAWSAWRLRAAHRAANDGEGWSFWRRQRLRARRRPACGDDPILWKEMYTAVEPTSGTARLVDRVLSGAVLVLLAAFLAWFARPALRELLSEGYGVATHSAPSDGMHPVARAIVMGPSAGPPPGRARAELNELLRQITAGFGVLIVMTLTTVVVTSVTTERTRDTWASLLATPLSGREILGAKMLGALWTSRAFLGFLLGMWTCGLVVGSIHPVGYLIAVAELAVACWFLVALGAYYSLRPVHPEVDAGRVLLPALLAFSGLLPVLLPARGASVLMGIGSLPLQIDLALVSYEDLRAALWHGTYPHLDHIYIRTGEGFARVVTTALIGLAWQTVAAFLLTRAAFRRFDEAVGRPSRPETPWSSA